MKFQERLEQIDSKLMEVERTRQQLLGARSLLVALLQEEADAEGGQEEIPVHQSGESRSGSGEE